jgi:hypothetical protein
MKPTVSLGVREETADGQIEHEYCREGADLKTSG